MNRQRPPHVVSDSLLNPLTPTRTACAWSRPTAARVTPPAPIATLRPNDVEGVADALQLAVKESKQPRTVLSAGRRKPIILDESAGVRLALTLIAAEPITKRSRREAILGGVAAMSSEETYYWFAKVTGSACRPGT